jgi:3-oxoacyl-[acyl-carrier protein] reductase
MQLTFEDKIVLVTASSRGIGFGIASAFHNAGARVAICARDVAVLKEAEATLESVDASRIVAVPGDIGDPSFLNSLTARVEEAFSGTPDILINNSGGPPAGDVEGFTDEDWMRAIDVNLLSVIRLSSLVLPGMRDKRWGRIINLTSTLAKEPAAGLVLSNVTRAGVAAYSKTLAHEVGQFGITVNTILTGGCLTERFYSLARMQAEETGESLEAAVARMEAAVPVRFISTPDQFAHTILFVASEDAGYMTGVAIPLDGGSSKSVF